jgi:nucleotide-binding universal stress UspA family protein
MSILLAALDAGAAARPVLETALRVGRLTGSDVEAVHVEEDTEEIPRLLAEGAGVPIRVVSGAVVPALLDVIASPDVIGAVVGARGLPGGRRPVGHTARHIVEQVDKPVVVVPPDVAGRSTARFGTSSSGARSSAPATVRPAPASNAGSASSESRWRASRRTKRSTWSP